MIYMKILTYIRSLIHLQTFFVSFGISVVWILGTDFIVHNLIPQEYNTELLQNLKGLCYIFILCILLSWLHKKEQKSTNLLMAKKSQAMIGEFSGMIVHEVKNPLHSIHICIQRIKDLLKVENIDGDRYIDLTEESILRLDETIDYLQGLSRGQSLDHVKFEEGFEVSSHLHKTFDFLKKSYFASFYKLDTQDIFDLKLKVNHSLISHVFLNLMKNAMDYMKEQKIENGVIKLSVEKNSKYIILGLENSGNPISPHIQAKLFNHFTSKVGRKGTGLGLLFCRQIMKAHGGEIQYDKESSTPKFLLKFPRNLVV